MILIDRIIRWNFEWSEGGKGQMADFGVGCAPPTSLFPWRMTPNCFVCLCLKRCCPRLDRLTTLNFICDCPLKCCLFFGSKCSKTSLFSSDNFHWFQCRSRVTSHYSIMAKIISIFFVLCWKLSNESGRMISLLIEWRNLSMWVYVRRRDPIARAFCSI